jgi:hypothetical protein
MKNYTIRCHDMNFFLLYILELKLPAQVNKLDNFLRKLAPYTQNQIFKELMSKRNVLVNSKKEYHAYLLQSMTVQAKGLLFIEAYEYSLVDIKDFMDIRLKSEEKGIICNYAKMYSRNSSVIAMLNDFSDEERAWTYVYGDNKMRSYIEEYMNESIKIHISITSFKAQNLKICNNFIRKMNSNSKAWMAINAIINEHSDFLEYLLIQEKKCLLSYYDNLIKNAIIINKLDIVKMINKHLKAAPNNTISSDDYRSTYFTSSFDTAYPKSSSPSI